MKTRAAVWLLLLLLAPLAALAQAPPPDAPLVVESLECRGNVTTSCRFILGQLYLSEGDRVDEEEIQNAKLRLQWLRNFSAVSIYLEKGSQRGFARVVVEVVEASAVTRELTLGVYSRNGAVGHQVQGRWTDNNLFGNGKVLDFKASALIPMGGERQTDAVAQLSYIDPHLFDSKRNYFSADIAYLDTDVDRDNGDTINFRQLALDLNFGRRLWDFSYITAGYQYRPISDRFWRVREEDGQFESHEDTTNSSLVVAYGWNSRDDQYFPTRGTAFNFTSRAPTVAATTIYGSRYSNTWTTSNGTTWIASFSAPDPSTRIEVQRPLAALLGRAASTRVLAARVRKGGIQQSGWQVLSGGFAAGVIFDSQRLGVVTLYVLGESSFNK